MREIPKEKMLKLSQNICEQITSYVKGSNANGVVIGLSGGIDSATVCALCSKVVNTKALIMPDGEINSGKDTEEAIELCKRFSIEYEIIDISGAANKIITSYYENISNDKLTIMNVKPRLRMIYLYMVANRENRLVAGTSNKTEILLGYFTKWGDGASDFLPIGNLWKTEVMKLGRSLVLPESILNKKPTAGLYKGQTDEGELGADYETIDELLYNHVIEKKNKEELERTFPPHLVNSLIQRIKKNEHKRVIPPSLELGL